jgi:hypothetical protein
VHAKDDGPPGVVGPDAVRRARELVLCCHQTDGLQRFQNGSQHDDRATGLGAAGYSGQGQRSLPQLWIAYAYEHCDAFRTALVQIISVGQNEVLERD